MQSEQGAGEYRAISRRRMMYLGCGVLAATPPLLAGEAGESHGVDGYVQSMVAAACIQVQDYGVQADGVTDDYEAIQHIFDAVLPAHGGIVQFPPGICRCSGRIICRRKPVILQGAGCGATRILFTGDREDRVGFHFDQHQYPNTLQVRDLSLITDQQEAGDALVVAYSPEDCMAMRVVQRVCLENITIVGMDIAEHGFRNGVMLRHVNAPVLFNVCVSGRQPRSGMEHRTHTAACFKLVAGAIRESMPVEAALIKCSGYNARYGVDLVGAHEGLVVTAGNFVECAVGISQVSGSESGLLPTSDIQPEGGMRPGIWVTDTHCNVFRAGVYLQQVVQGFISNCLLYKAPDAAQDCAGIRLAHCADIKIHHCNVVSHSRAGRFDGVYTEKNTSRCQIADSTFTWTDHSIHLGPGTTGVYAWDNVTQGGDSGAVKDEGQGNRFRALGENSWQDLGNTGGEASEAESEGA